MRVSKAYYSGSSTTATPVVHNDFSPFRAALVTYVRAIRPCWTRRAATPPSHQGDHTQFLGRRAITGSVKLSLGRGAVITGSAVRERIRKRREPEHASSPFGTERSFPPEAGASGDGGYAIDVDLSKYA